MNQLRRLFGLHPMNEAPADGGGAGSAAPAAAPVAAPEAAPAITGSLLGGDVAPPAEAAPADPAQPADKPDDAPKAEGAPEQYETFAVPEGLELSEDVLPDVHEAFREAGLSQEKAQALFNKLLDVQNKLAGTPEQHMQQMEQQIGALNADWGKQCKELPEIGGQNFEQSLALTHKVMSVVGTPELRELLTYSGLGSHPVMFKAFVAIGKAMSEDTFVQGGEPGPGPRSIEQRLWPDMKTN